MNYGSTSTATVSLSHVCDARQISTSYRYDSDGNLAEVESPLGAIESYAHDDLGRVLTESITYDGNPAQVVETTVYDKLWVDTVTGPPGRQPGVECSAPATDRARRLRC